MGDNGLGGASMAGEVLFLLRSPHQESPPCFERPKAVNQFPENVTEGHFVHAAQGRNVVEGRLAYKGASASDKDSLIKLGLVWPSPDCHPHSTEPRKTQVT